MRHLAIFTASALASALVAVPAYGQQRIDSTTTAVSGSNSGSSSNSGAASNSDQLQGQNQGQTQGQMLQSSQGNAQNITFNTTTPKKVEVMGNQNVPIAAAVSYSSDYCGGTASGGLSTSLGFSIGGGKPVQDFTCQALRRAEKYSIVAATASNMGYKEWGGQLLSMAIFELCRATRNADSRDAPDACGSVGLAGAGVKSSDAASASSAASASANPASAQAYNPVQITPAPGIGLTDSPLPLIPGN
jgi:hypothetical protein